MLDRNKIRNDFPMIKSEEAKGRIYMPISTVVTMIYHIKYQVNTKKSVNFVLSF